MLAIKGIYEDGQIILKRKPKPEKRMKVIVTFLGEVDKTKPYKIDLNKFSFKKSRAILKGYKGSLSETVIEERRNAL